MCEILSPVGSVESLFAALESGADAVYFGSKRFSARQNAQNLDSKQIKQAVFECHKRGVKIYQAINTLYFDDEKSELLNELKQAAQNGIDAIIVQDLGTVKTALECVPEMPLHASTQMTVHTAEGALSAKEMGFKRVVVSRECPVDTIKEIAATGVETEVFVHGALCMSVSGQCYLSAMLGSRSANRGLCAGACRLPFSACENPADKYALSLKDLCAFKSLNELKEAGVCSFKIEGRMKRPEYVAAATRECVSALKKGSCDLKLLRRVFSRSGFTNGYLDGKLGKDMFGVRTKEDAVAARETFSEIKEGYSEVLKRAEVSFEIRVKQGEKISLEINDGEGSAVKVFSDPPSFATKRAAEDDIIIRQIKKLGGTIYDFKDAKVELDNGLFVSAKELNDLRRRAVEELDKKRYLKNTVVKNFNDKVIKTKRAEKKTGTVKPLLRIRANKAEQLYYLDKNKIELISLPFPEIKKADVSMEKLCLELDRFMTDENICRKQIKDAYDGGITHFLAQNIAHFRLLKGLKDIKIHAGYSMNITNSDALETVTRLGASDAELSFELTEIKAQRIVGDIPTGVIVYGHLPLMLMRNCPISSEVGCSGCKGYLRDRKNKRFYISCHKDKGYFELLNGEPLYLFDKKRIPSDFETIMLTKENADEAKEVFLSYLENRCPSGEFTRGLYYRGVF